MPSADAAAARQRMDALRRAELLLQRGDSAGCIEALLVLAADAQDDPRLLQDIALRFTALGRHEDAECCSARARALCRTTPNTCTTTPPR